jgi:hypothetical protein
MSLVAYIANVSDFTGQIGEPLYRGQDGIMLSPVISASL